jgi:CoA:oxalate CoA-transferase
VTQDDAADPSAGPPLPAWLVLDLSQAISGPYAARVLADLGADVVRIEGPRTDVTEYFGLVRDGRSGLYAQMNAGKRSVAVDLSVPGAARLVTDLAGRADVLIENFRPGVMDRLGLGYQQLSAVNPALIMLSVSGFGPDGADAQRRALAPVIHAESGLIARQAELDGRPPSDLPLALADTLTALHAVVAVLAALHQRALTGVGQHVDLSMLAAVAVSDDHAHALLDATGEDYGSRGTIWQAPGGPLLIAAPPKHAWAMLSRRGLVADPAPPGSDLPTKVRLRGQAIQDWMNGFADRGSLLAALESAGVAWGEVRRSKDLFAGEAHSVPVPGSERRVTGLPYSFSAAQPSVRRPPPRRGQHNTEVLADWLGLDRPAVAALTRAGILLALDRPAASPPEGGGPVMR